MIDSFYLYLKNKINIGGYVGYMCSYVPPEILYSAGFEPLPLVFSPCYPEKTDEIYPKYFCPYIKNINEFLMRNEITLEKVVITDGCDSSKRIYECWKDLKLASEIYFLKIPFNKGESSIGYFAEELKDLYIKLLGYEDKGRLIDTINFYNSLRRTLINQGSRNILSYLYLYTGKILGLEKARESFYDSVKVYLLSSMLPLDFLSFLEDLDIEVLYLDSCFGEKNLEMIENYEKDPYLALSSYYLNKTSCIRDLDQKRIIKNIISKQKDIDGVIIYVLKYCDPLLFRIGIFREIFKGLNLPMLVVEDDYTLGNRGQIRTRIEAFKERIYEFRKNSL